MDSILEEDVAKKDVEAQQSQLSKNSQTASDFIDEQLALEADAREVLPYKFDKCTNILGPLRQEIYACLTCSPPPASAAQVYTAAGVCYSCSISCHGEHNLVELFNRRDFVCDCGTSRFPDTSSCTLRSDPITGNKGVTSKEPAKGNTYNHNFQNRFCACEEDYDAEKEKGTMFQCIGLGSVETGGCGEDWYHPECLMGLPRDWQKSHKVKKTETLPADAAEKEQEHPIPAGFPDEDDFEALVCYKCVESNPWIRRYAGSPGFLAPVFRKETSRPAEAGGPSIAPTTQPNLKRKASDDDDDLPQRPSSPLKRLKEGENAPLAEESQKAEPQTMPAPLHKHNLLPPAPPGVFSLFMKADFREHFCHCPSCYPHLLPHPQLVEEEDTYEPSVSSDGDSEIAPGSGTRSQGTGSLLDRGEAVLSTMDRVKAIEGVMVYNHLKDKVKAFLKPYAESGEPVGAEDIKAYFEKLRGDEAAIREAGARPRPGTGAEGGSKEDEGGDGRREQSGY